MKKEKSEARLLLERHVYAINTPLKDVISTMTNVILLRNAHPNDRDYHAKQLYANGELTKTQANEFLKYQVK